MAEYVGLKSAFTAFWNKVKSYVEKKTELPVGYVVELKSDKDPNDLFAGTWIEYEE